MCIRDWDAAVGDGGGAYNQPTVDQTELKNKKSEGEIASATISTTTANMIDVKIIVPADVGGFIVREAAIYSEDGTMIAVCNTPDTEKVAIDEGVSGKLTLLMHLIVADTSCLLYTSRRAAQQEEVLNRGLRNGASAADGMLGRVKSLVATLAAGAGIKAILGMSDKMTSTSARLSFLVDDGGSVDALEQKIMASAQRSRAAYLDTASAIASMGANAG